MYNEWGTLFKTPKKPFMCFKIGNETIMQDSCFMRDFRRLTVLFSSLSVSVFEFGMIDFLAILVKLMNF